MTYEEFLDFTRDKESLYELRNGVPTKMDAPKVEHQLTLTEFTHIFNSYLAGTNYQVVCPSCAVIFSNKEVRIPDLIIVCDKNKFQHGVCMGAPDFIVEILSSSSMQKDFENVELYLSNGVKEYWIVDYIEELIYIYLPDGTSICYEYPKITNTYSSLFPHLIID